MSNAESEKNVPSQPSLKTDRLFLRSFQSNDAPAVCAIVNNKSVASTTRSISLPYTVAMAEQWIAPQAKNWLSQSAAVFAICWMPEEAFNAPTEGPPLIGAVGLEINDEDEKAELGYWIVESHWGRGVATEAATAVVKFGFEMLCLNKIFASHMVKNPASGRVLEKIGMRQEGVFRDHVKKWGQFEDAVVYGILADDIR